MKKLTKVVWGKTAIGVMNNNAFNTKKAALMYMGDDIKKYKITVEEVA